jgi:hypothetical protein
MQNTNDEPTAESELDLQAPSLSAKQVKQRNTKLVSAANAFAEAVDKDAMRARGDLADKVFNRLSLESELSWQEHAELCVALCDIRTRDGLLRKFHDSPQLRALFQSHLICELARSQEESAAALATVYAGISWLEGQAEVTRQAVDHALAIDSTYSLAQLLDIALRHNVPSTVWSASLAAVSFDACLKGAA